MTYTVYIYNGVQEEARSEVGRLYAYGLRRLRRAQTPERETESQPAACPPPVLPLPAPACRLPALSALWQSLSQTNVTL